MHAYGSGAELWRLPPAVAVESAIQLLRDDELVEYIEPDCHVRPAATIPADANFPQQWSMYNTGQRAGCGAQDPNGTPGVDIDAILAWDITTGVSDPNQRPIIAVIDTGVDYNHPDLAPNMWVNTAEANGLPGIDDDNNQYTDDVYGYDFRDNDPDPRADADFRQGHGTHVAGIAGAVGKINAPSAGIAGVNWKSRIMPLKIYTSRTCESTALCSDARKAIDYAVMMHADVINASWDVDPNCPGTRTLEDAIRDAGRAEVLLVASAGNSGINLDPNNLIYPVGYTLDSIIGVTSTDNRDGQQGNYGAVSVDLGAPGDAILSTVPSLDCVHQACPGYDRCATPLECQPTYVCSPYTTTCQQASDLSPYDYRGGTSMAAPHVAGVAALLRAIKPGIPALSIKARILNNVDPNIPSLHLKTVTRGRLNAFKAVYPQESVAPAVVGNLARQNSPPHGITLTWTAPADGDRPDPVAFYDLRYSTSPITSANFSGAPRFWDVVKPLAAGQPQTTTVTGLSAYITYYFAIKSVDDWGNVSPMSNVASGQTCSVCTISFCKPWGDDLYMRCSSTSLCGLEGCCLYDCVVDPTCTAADPNCPPNVCAGACG